MIRALVSYPALAVYAEAWIAITIELTTRWPTARASVIALFITLWIGWIRWAKRCAAHDLLMTCGRTARLRDGTQKRG